MDKTFSTLASACPPQSRANRGQRQAQCPWRAPPPRFARSTCSESGGGTAWCPPKQSAHTTRSAAAWSFPRESPGTLRHCAA